MHRVLQDRSRALQESRLYDLIVWRLSDYTLCTVLAEDPSEARHQSGAADRTFLARTLNIRDIHEIPVFRGDAGIGSNLNLLAASVTTDHVTSLRHLEHGMIKCTGTGFLICRCADIKAG